MFTIFLLAIKIKSIKTAIIEDIIQTKGVKLFLIEKLLKSIIVKLKTIKAKAIADSKGVVSLE